MSIDLAINNVGEYFSAHYLADNNGFAKDIRDKTARWKEQGSQSPPRQLQNLGDLYFRAKARALDYPEPELRSMADEPDVRSWHPQLLQALGYQPDPFNLELPGEKQQLPVTLRLHRHGQPWLVVAQAPFCVTNGDWVEEPLEEMVEPASDMVEGLPTCIEPWEKAIALAFRQEDRPRWFMLLAGCHVYLFDAHSYSQGRYLYIDLDEAYARRDVASFNAIAALLSRETLAPTTESEEVLHEKLREGSLKSTHGVSEQLQGAVREAIELIANGWVEARRANNQGYRQLAEREDPLPDGSRQVTAEQLKHDALVYVYRILFCLYAEARGGELGILPISDEVYRLGYSLEALRDLADRGQPGTISEQGSYFSDHLSILFRLVHQGFHPESGSEKGKGKDKNQEGIREKDIGFQIGQKELFGNVQSQLFEEDKKNSGKKLRVGTSKAFIIQPLTATLFDPAATPLLDRISLSNRILQQVIRRLSLGTGSNNKQIGRINYAELGIVQLGSVYEGLLSYKGFFAEEDLIQVCKKPKKPAGKEQPVVKDNAIDPKEPTWFVPLARQGEFKTGEIIIEHRTGQPRVYKAGEFILHLNGVDRVNSASYYTPEVLTRTLVKEALKERLKDIGPEQADEILDLKICEPAMGSAAFLVEAIDQLGRHYLELKQEQLGKSIEPSEFEAELRRVRHYIAVHNVYGVDLNPVAVELGSLSLWLASIHSLKVETGENGSPDIYQPGQTPWFGLRLRAGNSLIGARRAVWTPGQLATGKHYGKSAEAPRQLKPGEQRKADEIYHFLVWDEDMAPSARDKLMKQYWPDECEEIKNWQTEQVKKKWSPEELAKGRDVCKQIDLLWEGYAEHRIEGLAQTECTATVWPIPSSGSQALKPGPSLAFQENLKANLESQSGAFQRLKLLMDSWCSFYFWPLQNSEELPSRKAWLAAAEVLLGCEAVEKLETRAMLDITLGDEIELEDLFVESQQQLPDAKKLASAVPWYEVAREVDNDQHFHHWELIFTEILGPLFEGQLPEPQGFDLIFGNPPWIKVAWNDKPLLLEFDPWLGAADKNTNFVKKQRPSLLESKQNIYFYRNVFRNYFGGQKFLGDKTLYPETAGIQCNLYKKFIEKTWHIQKQNGVLGLLTPEELFMDSNGGRFRRSIYSRLKKHYQFKNELKLFADVHNNVKFSINIFGDIKNSIHAICIFNLLHPGTIHKCNSTDDSMLTIPGLKNDNDKWELNGHSFRKIILNDKLVKLFNGLFEDKDVNYEESKLPLLHAVSFISILEKIERDDRRIKKREYFGSLMFHETDMQSAGLIEKSVNPTFKPDNESQWIILGPHYYLANPYASEPYSNYKNNKSYDAIDLADIPDNYIPRSIFKPHDAKAYKLYLQSSGLTDRYTNSYRYLNREMVQSGNERTLIPIVLPPKAAHVITSFGMSFEKNEEMVLFAAGNFSIVHDFFIKLSGTGHCHEQFLSKLPIHHGELSQALINRCLRLNCLTNAYADLWEELYKSDKFDFSTLDGERRKNVEISWDSLASEWSRSVAFRSCSSRRQALIEIDVLVALSLDITLEELILIYRVYFPVLYMYEKIDLYDTNGRRLPNTKRKDSGAKELSEATKMDGTSGPVTASWFVDNGNQTVTKTFYPPFSHVDRIEDYKTAYRVFSERLDR